VLVLGIKQDIKIIEKLFAEKYTKMLNK